MHRVAALFVVARSRVVYSLLLAGSVMAQNCYDCGDFDSQQEAQRVLGRDPSDPNNLDADYEGWPAQRIPKATTTGERAATQT